LKLRSAGFDHDIIAVAPFTGAWIETGHFVSFRLVSRVAPFTGAWIETSSSVYRVPRWTSRPLHGGVD